MNKSDDIFDMKNKSVARKKIKLSDTDESFNPKEEFESLKRRDIQKLKGVLNKKHRHHGNKKIPGKKKAKYYPLPLASKVISKRNLESSDSDKSFDPKECVKVKTTRQVKKRASKVLSKIIIESSDSDNSSDQNEYVKVKTTRRVKNLCKKKYF